MIETIDWMQFAGEPALFGLLFGGAAMVFFRRPTFGIVAAIFGALFWLGL